MEYTVIDLDKANFRASRVNSAVAPRTHKHGCHPQMVRPSCLNKKVTAQFEGPTFWVITPVATLTPHLYKSGKALGVLEYEKQRLLEGHLSVVKSGSGNGWVSKRPCGGFSGCLVQA